MIGWCPLAFSVDIIHMNSQFIHCFIKPRNGDGFECTFVYGFNDPCSRNELWSGLKNIAGHRKSPWILMGYFNALSEVDDRVGSNVRNSEVAPMRECLMTCELVDVKASGRHFTWNNKQEGNDRVFSRIDRVIATHDWVDKYDMAEASFLPEGNYDHTPILLCVYPDEAQKRPFKFHNMWCNHNSLLTTVRQAWKVCMKLKKVKAALRNMNKEGFGDVEAVVIKAQHELNKAQDLLHRNPADSGYGQSEKEALLALKRAKKNQFALLQQQAKINWLKCGDDITAAVLDFFSTGQLLKVINVTTLTMIPKVRCPENVAEFRPIACCTILYKCITKLISERLNLILPEVVSCKQGAFVAGRSILHNIFTCQDLVKLYNRKTTRASCMMKLDLKKAYDTISWDFVRQMLTGVGFPSGFVDKIMLCITTPMFSIMINGSMCGFFKAQRGLRQGDPISPLIFALCMDYLDRILSYVSEQHGFKYHSMCKELKLTHLSFADDLLLFCHGDCSKVFRCSLMHLG
ncbi:uncharacterized protein LOC125496470 [Beta vulgaris subsp. vulgaris]|uniref:uncharacterized protein LOC125496470 n=1 Tax=Beta vulgaris subsp. vulgaris TaxID=3555 RepID=UPI0020375750|nr:uncharacterized protein LOC125496470 [Beta vulgaris subsp. vulgaris]